MVKASKGFRRSTRRRLRKEVRHKLKVTPYLRKFKEKDKVMIKIDPSSHKGMPFPKFKGKLGEIKERRGNSYVVEVKIGDKKKEVIARPEHLVLENKTR